MSRLQSFAGQLNEQLTRYDSPGACGLMYNAEHSSCISVAFFGRGVALPDIATQFLHHVMQASPL